MKWRYVILPLFTALLIAGMVFFAYLHGASLSVMNPQGPVARGELNVITITVLLSSIVVIPVFVMLFIFAYRYRADGAFAKRKHQPNWDHDNWIAEALWWLVPAIIILCLAFIAWRTSHELDPFKPIESTTPPITIQVVALDWKWLFIYPAQGIATVNMVEFPANTPVRFEITADAPMNQFWIPSLGGQIMAMPGMTTELNLMADKPGTYNGLSSNISGNGFAGMTFTAASVSQSDFDAWVANVKETSNPLTNATYAGLAKQSKYVPVTYYWPVDPALYTAVTMKYMMQ